MTQTQPALAGEFELEQRPADVWRGLRHALGFGLVWLVVMWVGSVFATISSWARGDEADSARWVALGLTFSLGFLAWSTMKSARATRRYRVCITDAYLAVVQEASEVRLAWSSLQTVKQGAGVLSLRGGQTAIALPWYRLSEVQRQAIEERLRAHGKSERASRAQTRTMVLWVLLVFLFVTIYNLVSAP